MPNLILCRILAPMLAAFAMILLPVGGAVAQQADGELAQAIRDAMAGGARVIILNGDGALAGATGAEAASTETPSPMKDASALMQAQAEISGFRETLRERLTALPNSLNEVALPSPEAGGLGPGAYDSLNAFVIGYRRSRPKLLRVIFTPGGAWRRLYSAE